MKQFGKTISIDMKQELTNWIFKNIDHLYEGVYYYLRVWKKRNEKRLNTDPNSPVIPKYKKMEDILNKIKDLQQFKKKFEFIKNKKESEK